VLQLATEFPAVLPKILISGNKVQVKVEDGLSGAFTVIHGEVITGGLECILGIILKLLADIQKCMCFGSFQLKEVCDMSFGDDQMMSFGDREFIRDHEEIVVFHDDILRAYLAENAIHIYLL
jgi:hypothetical protein